MTLTVVTETVYFGESKRSLKSRSDEHKESVGICDFENNEIAKTVENQITTLA